MPIYRVKMLRSRSGVKHKLSGKKNLERLGCVRHSSKV